MYSKKAVITTWNTGHDIANSTELVLIQLVLSLLTLALMSSDLLQNVQGIRDLLTGKPVMTYDLLAGLERRKLLLVVVSLGAMPALLYTDATTGHPTAISSAIPGPSSKRLSFSPAIFFYTTHVVVVPQVANE
ncbi:hypothetical protein AC1031_007828 [Aphanomyces cochlioides]|nr:hypothetical protein AC1031_007828 [Aphanomyces cochlioides]